MYDAIVSLYGTEYFRFILTLMLSFLTGLEMREYKRSLEKAYFIGTVRTYTFIGMLGYILYILDPLWRLYLAGLAVLTVLFALFYYRKLMGDQKGIISLLVSLLVYTYAPIIMTQPLWFTVLVFVSIIFIVNAKGQVQHYLNIVDNTEVVTFAKLLLLSAVIWPLLPTAPVSEWIPISLSKIWLAVVVVSSISYIGYLLQRYLYHEKGFLVNGIVGGIYSSTATTVVLARQSKQFGMYDKTFISAIVLATGMMHLRLLAILGFLNFSLFQMLAMPLGIMGGIGLLIGYGISRLRNEVVEENGADHPSHMNPLELGVALVFAVMFVIITVITRYFIDEFGVSGLNLLATLIGFTDIDPFILSLINGTYPISQSAIASAILIAIASNHFFKGLSALVLGSRRVGWASFGILGLLSAMTFAIAFWA